MDAPKTAYELFARSAEKFPHKAAIVFIDRTGEKTEHSYRELLTAIDAAADRFCQFMKKGETACILLPNSPAFVIAYLALSKIGAIPVLLNPALPKERVEKIIHDTEALLLIERNTEAEKLLFSIHCTPRSRLLPDDSGDTAVILYSSGTTGEQKGVELTVSNLYHNIRTTVVRTGITPDDRPLCCLPLTHCFGLNFIMGACFYAGATLVLHEKFDLAQMLDSLVENHVTMFFATPAIYRTLLNERADPFYFTSVRYFFYAADALGAESILSWEREYGRTIYTGWGLTETSPFATSNHPAIYKLGSVGKPIPGVEVKVVDDAGTEIRMSSPVDMDYREKFYGEICVRGHNVMKGYWNNPEATADSIDSDGWFHTGDVGYLDSEGYLFIVDRIKDMINVGGEKAWPAQIEKIILQHPDVEDAAVIGIPHPTLGEVPAVFIATRNLSFASDEFLAWASARLMKHEVPRTIFFIEKIPRNPSGKILRRELKKQLPNAS